MGLMPIQLGLKVDATALGIEPERLCNRRIHVCTADAEACAATVPNGRDRGRIIQIPSLVLIVRLDLPGIVLHGMIGKDRQHVSALSRLEYLTVSSLVMPQ